MTTLRAQLAAGTLHRSIDRRCLHVEHLRNLIERVALLVQGSGSYVELRRSDLLLTERDTCLLQLPSNRLAMAFKFGRPWQARASEIWLFCSHADPTQCPPGAITRVTLSRNNSRRRP